MQPQTASNVGISKNNNRTIISRSLFRGRGPLPKVGTNPKTRSPKTRIYSFTPNYRSMTITWVFAHKRSIKAPNCWPITVRLLGLPFNNQRFILAQQLDLPPSPHPPTFQRTFKKTILGRSKTRPLSTPFDDLMLTQSRTRNGRVSNEGQGGPGRARRSRNASGSLNPASGSSNPGLHLLRLYI